MHLCFHFMQVLPVGMSPLGKVFDFSTSLFESQRVLYNSIRDKIWLGQFTPVRNDHLLFVQAQFQAFTSLGVRCAPTGPYNIYIARMLGRLSMEEGLCVCYL